MDVPGSMQPANKLPLLKSALRMLVNQMRPQDRVAIVVYAGAGGLVLDPTSGEHKETILEALSRPGAPAYAWRTAWRGDITWTAETTV